MRICSVEGCAERHFAKSYCRVHYERARKYGSPDVVLTPGPRPRSERERFWAKVDRSGDCWIWTGSKTQNGYGSCHFVGETLAHRWAYREFVGEIPEGLHIDHLCRVRDCVNPAHLEAVTQRENNDRAGYEALHAAARLAAQAENARRRGAALARTHCTHGHEYTEANTYWGKTGTRLCRKCAANATREYLSRKAKVA